jgi:hypothetical protein
VGLLHPDMQARLRADGATVFDRCPSLDMWADYLPNARIVGVDILDFSGYRRDRVTVLRADQGDRESLRAAVASAGGQFDLIIDDGSHASHHQQITLGTLFGALEPGGIYIIEDLHWQPPELERDGIVTTRRLLQVLHATRDLRGLPSALTPEECRMLEAEVGQIAFFDSLDRYQDVFDTRDTLAVIERPRR